MPMPTLVIDISSKAGVISPKLLVTGGTPGNWVALSHCWGRWYPAVNHHQKFRSKAARAATFRPSKKFPRFNCYHNLVGLSIFMDRLSVHITRIWDWLGCWVKPNDQCVQACDITLAAECASSVDSGILHPRTSDDDAIPIAYQSYSRNFSGWFYIRQIEKLELDARNPLESRGWTLQESLVTSNTTLRPKSAPMDIPDRTCFGR
jgi:hypothetical protein